MLKRLSISLEENLLDSFDKYIKEQSYNNRSEAIRDLIRKSLVREEWETDNKVIMGVITLVYDHHQHQLQEKVTEVQHDYHHHIVLVWSKSGFSVFHYRLQQKQISTASNQGKIWRPVQTFQAKGIRQPILFCLHAQVSSISISSHILLGP